ncbi:MAG TPA: membrane protein insertase YidC [Bryobacteraceae bacterium]|nr:membrane protein insertase YidC [Bryobacteraceae bacterium]
MEKKEMTMEVRLLLALVLVGLVIILTPYFYKPPPPQTANKPVAAQTKNPPAAQNQPAQNSEAQSKAAEANPKPAAPAKPGLVIPGAVQADNEETLTVDTDLYRVVFSNRGATVKSWILKKYKDAQNKPVDLVNPQSLGKVPAPFSIAFTDKTASSGLSKAVDEALYKVTRPDPLTLKFEFSDGHVAVEKSFQFKSDSYLVAVSDQVSQDGAAVPNSLAWRGGFGDATVVNASKYQQALYYDVSNSKLVTKPVKDAKDGPVSSAGQYSFAGLEDSYFAAVYLPDGQSQLKLTEFSDAVPDAAGKPEQRVGAAVGGEGSNSFTLFAGPKDYDLLHKVNPKLETLIDWGWFKILAKPIFLVLNWTAGYLTHNYGWAIIFITVVINMLMFPLKISSMKSAKKQQAIQPLIKAINEKYKGIPMRDPRQAGKNEELMGLYKKYGINPVGGCLPMLIQLPFLYAFYKVLEISIELRGAPFLWVHDLSQPETLPIRMLPVILVITQFMTQKMTPSPGIDPSQQKMMLFMPLVFGYMFYFLSAGLVLYYLTSNLVGVAQQWFLNRTTPAPELPPAPVPKKKSRN